MSNTLIHSVCVVNDVYSDRETPIYAIEIKMHVKHAALDSDKINIKVTFRSTYRVRVIGQKLAQLLNVPYEEHYEY